MKFPRVLAESEDFFAGLQHPDSPVQIRSAPLVKIRRNVEKSTFLLIFFFFLPVCTFQDTEPYSLLSSIVVQ